MPSLGEQQPYKTSVQGGLRRGSFVNARFISISAGPPNLADIGAASLANPGGGVVDVVYPVGNAQNFVISQNKNFSSVWEIGSDRKMSMPGRHVGQASVSRVLWHGPNLLRAFYAYYSTRTRAGTYPIDPLFVSEGASNPLSFPFAAGNSGIVAPDLQNSKIKVSDGLHAVRYPPGFDNYYGNLQSDLFEQPIGILVTVSDNDEIPYASLYLENCNIPAYTFGFDAQGLMIQESMSIMFERIIPIKTAGTQVMDGILPDLYGARSF